MRICLLASGSNGNACLLEVGERRVLVDVGLGPRILARRLALLRLGVPDITDVLLTHEHIDHVRGLAALTKKQPDLRVYATAGTREGLLPELRRHVHRVRAGEPFRMGPLEARPIPVSHDANEPVGYRVETPDGALGYATDLGFFDHATVEALAGCETLVLESNHCPNRLARGPYPEYLKRRVAGPEGHLSNPQARSLVEALLHPGLRYLALAHLSGVNNTPRAVVESLADLLQDLPAGHWAVGRRDGALEPVVVERDAPVRYPGQLDLPL